MTTTPDDDEIDIPLELHEEDEDIPPTDVAHLVPAPLMDVLPADYQLPALLKFVPNEALRTAAVTAAERALAIDVTGVEGLKAADAALAELREAQAVITEHFKGPCELADKLHKGLTGRRAEWLQGARLASFEVGARVSREMARLQALEDAQAQEQIAAGGDEDLNATMLPPRPTATALASSTIAKTWKARIVDTPAGSTEQQPAMGDLTTLQQTKVLAAMKALVEQKGTGSVPMTAFEINWPVLNKRAAADKRTFHIPGFEAYEERKTRGKGGRRR